MHLEMIKILSGQTLLQAIARMNRLHLGKDYAYIIDYYGVVAELHDALELYSSLEGKFDAEDLEGMLKRLAQKTHFVPAPKPLPCPCGKVDELAIEKPCQNLRPLLAIQRLRHPGILFANLPLILNRPRR